MSARVQLTAMVLVFGGCVGLPSDHAPAPAVSPLEATFEAAASEYQVPAGVLKAIAQVETRISHAHQPSQLGGYGVMHLIGRSDWNTLDQGARLTGATPGRLKVDPHANIRGAAAVLRELADRSFAEYPDLDPADPADFWQAVSLYPGLASALVAQDYATQVYRTLEEGFQVESHGGLVAQSPMHTAWRRHVPYSQVQRAVKEYPSAYQWLSSPNYSTNRESYRHVLIHTTQGSYAGAISWFQQTRSGVSAHYVIRSSDGQVTQMVEHSDVAWHAQCYNRKSIGIEHEGFVAEPAKWYTDAMYGASAKLTRWITDRHAMARNRTTIIGHKEVPPSCNTGGHTDPGSGWNWTKYMGLVNGTSATPTTGKLTGIIYTGGNTANRVADALVSVGSKTFTTGTNGIYEFVLAPGTYTVSVAKTGYTSNQITAPPVVAGQTTWGSMEVNPETAKGTLKGKIYVYESGKTAAQSAAISGAVVKVGLAQMTTGADGVYSFSLAPGRYTASVTASGFNPGQVTRDVVANAEVWGSMGLSSSATPPPPDTTPPELSIALPQNGASLETAVHQVSGTVSDNAGPIASVQLRHNGGSAINVPVTSGAYSHSIKLTPGANTLQVFASDAAANASSAQVSVSFRAGLSGRLFVAENEAVAVPDATVQLYTLSGDLHASAQTDAGGAFSLDLTAVPGDFVLVAKASGFITHSETLSVPDDARLDLAIPLTEGSEVLPTEVGIALVEPVEGQVFDGAQAVVSGAVSGFQLAAASVNGVPAEIYGGMGFSAVVPLAPGANTLEAVGVGVQGERVSATVNVTRSAQAGPAPTTQVEGISAASGCSTLPLQGAGGAWVFLLAAGLARLRARRR